MREILSNISTGKRIIRYKDKGIGWGENREKNGRKVRVENKEKYKKIRN